MQACKEQAVLSSCSVSFEGECRGVAGGPSVAYCGRGPESQGRPSRESSGRGSTQMENLGRDKSSSWDYMALLRERYLVIGREDRRLF